MPKRGVLVPEGEAADWDTLFPKGFRPLPREGWSAAFPDFSIAAIEFASGTVARLTANFYVGFHSKQRGIEFHGDKGSLSEKMLTMLLIDPLVVPIEPPKRIFYRVVLKA